MNETRPLTRREQLEWYLKFLYEEKQRLNREIEVTEINLKLIKKDGCNE